MGCTVREKHIRTNRRTRSVKPEPDHSASTHANGNAEKSGNPNPSTKPKSYHMCLPSLSAHGWGYCTEEQLEEILLKNLDFLYNDAIGKLASLGYGDDVALNAILRNGHCYGGQVETGAKSQRNSTHAIGRRAPPQRSL